MENMFRFGCMLHRLRYEYHSACLENFIIIKKLKFYNKNEKHLSKFNIILYKNKKKVYFQMNWHFSQIEKFPFFHNNKSIKIAIIQIVFSYMYDRKNISF